MSISGDTVATWNASGRNAIYLTNQSGNVAASIRQVGDNFNNADGIMTQANVVGFDDVSQRFQRIRTTTSGSSLSANGSNFKLNTCVSGDTVVAEISGQTIFSSISGNTINVNTSISGNVLSLQQSSLVSKIPIIKTGNILLYSGLNYLPDIPVSSGVVLTFANQAAGSSIFGGVSGNEPTFSGFGPYPTRKGTTNYIGSPLPISNLNQVSIYFTSVEVATSGEMTLNYFNYFVSGWLN